MVSVTESSRHIGILERGYLLRSSLITYVVDEARCDTEEIHARGHHKMMVRGASGVRHGFALSIARRTAVTREYVARTPVIMIARGIVVVTR